MKPDGAQPSRNKPAPARVRGEEILATTVELVREQGLSNVRVADVAERAGTTTTSVIYYFASKGQLFGEAVADADAAFYARLLPELASLDSGIDRLARLIVRSSASEWPLWMDTWLLARQHPELREAEMTFETSWCNVIADAIRQGVSRGEFHAVAPDDVALRISALTEGLAIHMVLGHPGRTREHYVEMLMKTAAAELGCDEAALLTAAARVPPEPAAEDVQTTREGAR
jgi:AcrR family transcriptional regulator